jgi:hypothetical protein
MSREDVPTEVADRPCRIWARRCLLSSESAWAGEYRRLLLETARDASNQAFLIDARTRLESLQAALGRLVGDRNDPCRRCAAPLDLRDGNAEGLMSGCDALQELAAG